MVGTATTTTLGRFKAGADGVLQALYRTPEFQRLARIIESVPVTESGNPVAAKEVANHIIDELTAELYGRVKK